MSKIKLKHKDTEQVCEFDLPDNANKFLEDIEDPHNWEDVSDADESAAAESAAKPAVEVDAGEGQSKPTRAQLDAALGRLPSGYTDANFVVNGMRRQWGDVFTDADEAKVRELVKPDNKQGAGKTDAPGN